MHFQRFTASDPALLQKEIEETRQQLLAAQAADDAVAAFELAADLGRMLTTARRETEARAVLLEHLSRARAQDAVQAIGWLLLYLATANQYLDDRTLANEQFAEALSIASAQDDPQLKHFVLHHWGRCLVETGDYARAKDCFERALELRVALNVPWQESTRRALAALAALSPPA